MATYSTPIPGVPQYGQAALAAKTAYQNALTRINQRRSSLGRESGFAFDVDPVTGVPKNMRVDGSNQYGGIQQLNRSQAQRDESARWAGIERGLGAGGGLAGQLRSQERYEFGKEDSNLAQQLISSLSGLQDEQNTAAYDRDRALYEAELEAARFAIQNQDFNPADFSEVDQPAPAGPSPAAQTSSKAKPKPITNHRAMELAAAAAAKKKKPKTSPNLWFK